MVQDARVKQSFIRQEHDWELHKRQCPLAGSCDVKAPKFPFIVFAILSVEDAGRWDYFFFTVSEAHLLLGSREYTSTLAFEDRNVRGIRIEVMEADSDERGHLVELFRKDEIQAMGRKGGLRIDYPPMAYISRTRAGQIRGPHEHASQTDIFVFCQSVFEVFLWDIRENSITYRCRQKVTTSREAYFRLVIPPGIVHAYRAIEDGLVVNCPDKLYRGWGKKQPVDEVRHEDDPGSPFQLW